MYKIDLAKIENKIFRYNLSLILESGERDMFGENLEKKNFEKLIKNFDSSLNFQKIEKFNQMVKNSQKFAENSENNQKKPLFNLKTDLKAIEDKKLFDKIININKE